MIKLVSHQCSRKNGENLQLLESPQFNGTFVVFSGSLPVKPGVNRVQYMFNWLFDYHGVDVS